MHNWDDLRYFLAVARTGSFIAASQSLSVNGSTVGRRVDQLEAHLKCKLFDRHRQGMALTPEGRKLLDHVEQMERAAQSVESSLLGSDDALSGTVRISVTDGVGSFWLTPNLVHFQKSYPQIFLEVQNEGHFADLSNREADIAIRLQEPTQLQLKSRKMGVIRFQVFAAPAYIDSFGTARDWSDLKGHKIINYQGYQDSKALSLWQETVKNHDQVVFHTNSAMSFISALRAGVGVGMLPKFYSHAVSDLVALDLACDVFEMPVFLVTHEESGQSARIQAVKNYIADLFERDRRAWFS